MLSEILAWCRLGVGHILALDAYDHLLFLAALVAGETGRLRRLLILVTAFTIGHSLTLALAAFDVVHFDPSWVEFFVAFTILATSLLNLLPRDSAIAKRAEAVKYALALLFGLVHGLAFSQTLAPMLGGGEAIVPPLFGFNLGVEAGQLVVVAAIVLLVRLAQRAGVPRHRLVRLLPSALTASVALVIMAKRLP